MKNVFRQWSLQNPSGARVVVPHWRHGDGVGGVVVSALATSMARRSSSTLSVRFARKKRLSLVISISTFSLINFVKISLAVEVNMVLSIFASCYKVV